MKYILAIASFNAFFVLVLLLQKKPKLLQDQILVFWLFFLGLSTAGYALTLDNFSGYPLLASGIIASFLLHGPFLHLYVSALTLNKKEFKLKTLWHFTPFLAFIVYLIVASRFPTYSEGISLDHVSQDAKTPFLFHFFLTITALSGPVYFFLAYKKFQQTKKSSLNFSSKEMNLEWLGILIPIFGAVWTILIVIAVIHHIFHLFSMELCTNGLFLSLSAFIILIGYFGLKQKVVLTNDSIEKERDIPGDLEGKYAGKKMGEHELQQCCNKVSDFMRTKRPYLDSDLTLPKLAEDLNVSTHHLSQVINEMHDKNFFNFINKYRVEEVKRKIQDPEYHHYSLLGIALESGFNSKSAFNRAFKNFTGSTPSQFRDSLPSS